MWISTTMLLLLMLLLLLLVAMASSSYLHLKASSSKTCKEDLRQRDGRMPPGPGSTMATAWRETLSFLAANGSGRGFYDFVRARYIRHAHGGPCFRTAIFSRTHVFLSAAVLAGGAASKNHGLLAADPPAFSKRYVRTASDLLGAHSILCASHAHHRFARRALAPLFAMPSTAAFAATFDRLTADLMQTLQGSPGAVVVLDGALRVTFRAICDMLVGAGAHDDAWLDRLQSDVFDVTQAMLALPLNVPGTRFHRGMQARKRIMAALRQEIHRRRRGGLLDHLGHGGDGDFLQVLLLKNQHSGADSDAAGAALTDDQILDNMLTLIIAGQVTTATAITWMVKYLGDNKQIQEKIRSIQLELAPKQDHLTLQDLNSMDYAYKAVKETLRMATIVSWFPRVALQDCQVAGFHIEKDWIVNVDARALHYDPAIYDNPTVFDPSRFNNGSDGGNKRAYSMLVFGAGGRTCLGMNLAKIMMLIFLHRLVTTFRWEMADDDESLEKWAMFPRLKNGCPIQLTPLHKN